MELNLEFLLSASKYKTLLFLGCSQGTSEGTCRMGGNISHQELPQAQHHAPGCSGSALPYPVPPAPKGSPARTGASPGLHVTLCHTSKPLQKPVHWKAQCLIRRASHRSTSDPQDFSIQASLVMRKWPNGFEHNLILEAVQLILRSAEADFTNSTQTTLGVFPQPRGATHP